MNNNEIILDLLQKKELSNDDQKILQQIIAGDADANKFYKNYLNTGEVVKTASHPDPDELTDYILVKNENIPENDDIIPKIPFIENHIQNCTRCSEEIKLLNAEYSEAEQFLSAEMNRDRQPDYKKEVQSQVRRKNFPLFRFAYASVAAVIFIYFGLYFLSGSLTPNAQKFAALDQDTDYYVTRGRVTTHFQESLKSLEGEDYESAIANLKLDINENPGDETVFYSYYILGLAYLETAETNFIGLFPSYNSQRANAGKDALLKTIEQNTSGKYPNITLNAYYYAAKACLMINDLQNAKEYLSIVVKNKGSKMNEAQIILYGLE